AMSPIDLSQFNDDVGITIILGGPRGVIDGASLADIVSGLTRTLQAIGAVADPLYEIEVGINDVSPGSISIRIGFKKILKGAAYGALIYTATQIIPAPKDIIGGLLASYIWDKYKPATPCTTHLREDNRVHIKGDNCDVLIDREVYEMTAR